MEEANYKYFAASLEKARIDEALDPTKMPNISAYSGPPLLAWRPKNAIRLPWEWLALGLPWALRLHC